MRPFTHRSRDQRIVFGNGARSGIADELEAMSASRVLMITGGSAAATARAIAGTVSDRLAGTFEEVVQHVPEDLARRATETAQQVGASHLLSVGGGSATGLAKALAVRLGTPIVAVPTTYSGSEMTPIWAATGQTKRTGLDDRALPATVVYDPELTVDLPERVSAASGMNAMAQAIAAVMHEPTDPIAVLQAQEAMRRLVDALPVIAEAPRDLDARGAALYGACLAGRALTATGTGLHHRLAHILGGRYGVVHADLHTVLLPHTTAHMRRLAPDGFQRLCRALSTDDPAGRLFGLARRIGAPTSLARIGVPSDAHEVVLQDLHRQERDPDQIRALLDDAHRGAPPVG